MRTSATIVLGNIQLLPCVLILSSTITASVLGLVYALLLWRFWSSTRIGTRFFRAFYLSTLRLEKLMLGCNVKC